MARIRSTADSSTHPTVDAAATPPPSQEVEVWSTYEGTWVAGFELAAPPEPEGDTGFLIRRRSDGMILPERFGGDRIRRPDGG